MKITKQNAKKISALLTLLEDENSDIATFAMKGLLDLSKNELSHTVKNLQETPNLKLRKRIHQLQSIIKIRENRDKISGRFLKSDSSLIKGLIEIHLLWYDRDSDEELKKQVRFFLNNAKNENLDSLFKIALFMKKDNFAITRNNELEPDAYCIGAVLDSKFGSDILLCSLAYAAGNVDLTGKFKIICKNKRFFLVDSAGFCCDPLTWEVEKIDSMNAFSKFVEFDTGMILRFLIYQLLLCSICTTSYRYVYTISKCIENAFDEKSSSSILDKPFNGEFK